MIMAYRPTIGLEVHIELKTKSKMFCSCLNDPDEKHPNVNVCPICLGHPGTLPVINEEAVKKTIKTGLSLNCKIAEHSKFDRKNYFYPDLPKGYQISQLYQPLCQNGYLEISKKINGRKIIIEVLKAGDIFGEMAYIDKTPRSATATAVGTTEVGIIDREFFDKEFNKLSADFQQMLKRVVLRLRKTTGKWLDLQKGTGG